MKKIILLFVVSISLVFAGYYEEANSAYVHKNYKQASELYKKAAKSGNAYALYNLRFI